MTYERVRSIKKSDLIQFHTEPTGTRWRSAAVDMARRLEKGEEIVTTFLGDYGSAERPQEATTGQSSIYQFLKKTLNTKNRHVHTITGYSDGESGFKRGWWLLASFKPFERKRK